MVRKRNTQDTRIHPCLCLYVPFRTVSRVSDKLPRYVPAVRSSNCCIPNILISLGLCPLLGILFSFLRDKNIILKILGFFGSVSLEMYCIQEWIAEELNETLLARFSPLVVNLILFAIIVPSTLGIAKVNRLIQQGIAHFIPSIRNSHDPSSAER